MRRLKIALTLAVAIGALSIAVAPALAGEFTASRTPKPLSESEPAATKGKGIGATELGGTERNQELKFGPFRIYCAVKSSAKTIDEGAVSWDFSSTFATEVTFTKCLTKANYEGFIAGTKTAFNLNSEKKAQPVKFVYHVNGVAELGTGAADSEVEVGSGTATFTIGGKLCKINWPRQIVPAKSVKDPEASYSAASYSTNEVPVEAKLIKKFPSGFQQKLVIANEFKGMEWSFEEGQCLGEGGFEEAAKREEGKTAFYKGTLEEELKGSNLGFDPLAEI